MKLTVRFPFLLFFVAALMLSLGRSVEAGVKASQQLNTNCAAIPDSCNATALGACSPDEQNTGEHVNDVEVSTTTPKLGDTVQVSCHMGDGGDTDRDSWELWYNDGNGWVKKASVVDPDGCGAGVMSCVFGPHNVTITGKAGTQAFRCINSYSTTPSTNACRSTDSWYDIDEMTITATASACGNGTVDAGEACDGANLNGQSCTSQGFTGGTLRCSASCTFDTSSCTSPPATTLHFSDQTQNAGFILSPDIGGWHGSYLADYDGDGDDDIFMTSHGIQLQDDTGWCALFRNNGNNTFQEVAKQAKEDSQTPNGVAGRFIYGRFTRELHGAAWLDYDNDGDFDLYIPDTDSDIDEKGPNQHGYDEMYRNNGAGLFSRVSPQVGFPQRDLARRGVVAGDWDRDGDVDLFVLQQVEIHNGRNASTSFNTPINPYGVVWFNQLTEKGTPTFCFEGDPGCHGRTGVNYTGWSQGVTTIDFDGNGTVDVLEADEETGTGLRLWSNDGNGNFTNVADTKGLPGNGVKVNCVVTGDVDNDGDMDVYTWYTPDTGTRTGRLYKNNGGQFTLAQSVGGAEHMFFADLDNDGDLDLISGGVFLNNGTGTFGSDQQSPLGLISKGRGGMAGDFDLDGDLDVIMNVDDRNVPYLRYYVNDLSSPNNWLRIKLTGPGGQAGAPGAKVWVYEDGTNKLLGFREVVTATGGFVDGPSPTQHFGLGTRARVYVKVQFVNGQVVETPVLDSVNDTLSIAADDFIGPNDPPVISNVQASAGQTSATITWDTNEASDSRVRWGTTVNYTGDSGVVQSNVTRHSVTLSGLTAGTTYHYVVLSSDGVNPATTSSDLTFQTTAPDTTPPTISGVAATNVTTSSATIVWTTNEASSTEVDYGLTTAYGSTTPLNSSLVTAHSVALSGLIAGTTYHFRVKSADAAGNLGMSGDFTFTTAADTTPPAISGVAATNVTSSAATIGWTTNEASNSQVEYGATTAYGSVTSLNPALVTAHSAALSSLAAATLYHYRVKSADAANNLGVSGDFTFTTAPAGPVITKASQQWNADCSIQPGDACNATAFTTCSPDDNYGGEHVNDVVVTTTTPRLGDAVQVSCHMGDFGDTDRDVWELWYNDGNGWVQKAKLVDADGCGQGVLNCIWANTITITGKVGTQAVRCINHYTDSTTTNACRTDSAYDVDEIKLTVNP